VGSTWPMAAHTCTPSIFIGLSRLGFFYIHGRGRSFPRRTPFLYIGYGFTLAFPRYGWSFLPLSGFTRHKTRPSLLISQAASFTFRPSSTSLRPGFLSNFEYHGFAFTHHEPTDPTSQSPPTSGRRGLPQMDMDKLQRRADPTRCSLGHPNLPLLQMRPWKSSQRCMWQHLVRVRQRCRP
jgi:hypothetical protein